MIYFVRFNFMYPIWCTRTQKRLTNPETLIKVNVHISGSVKTYKLQNLQRVQNSLARVVTKSTRFTSSKPLLKRLHWLPIASRIDFKIATLTYKAVHLKQPHEIGHIEIKAYKINHLLYYYKTSGQDMTQPSGCLERCPK